MFQVTVVLFVFATLGYIDVSQAGRVKLQPEISLENLDTGLGQVKTGVKCGGYPTRRPPTQPPKPNKELLDLIKLVQQLLKNPPHTNIKFNVTFNFTNVAPAPTTSLPIDTTTPIPVTTEQTTITSLPTDTTTLISVTTEQTTTSDSTHATNRPPTTSLPIATTTDIPVSTDQKTTGTSTDTTNAPPKKDDIVI